MGIDPENETPPANEGTVEQRQASMPPSSQEHAPQGPQPAEQEHCAVGAHVLPGVEAELKKKSAAVDPQQD